MPWVPDGWVCVGDVLVGLEGEQQSRRLEVVNLMGEGCVLVVVGQGGKQGWSGAGGSLESSIRAPAGLEFLVG